MTLEQNIRAILEWNFPIVEKKIINIAVSNIMNLYDIRELNGYKKLEQNAHEIEVIKIAYKKKETVFISEDSIIDLIHSTMGSFIEADGEEMTDRDEFVLTINKELCNKIKELVE